MQNRPIIDIYNRLIVLKLLSKSEGGDCYGMANMANQAILSGEWRRFNRRLQLIGQIPIDTFPAEFAALQAEHLRNIKTSKEIAEREFARLSEQDKELLAQDKRIQKIQLDLNDPRLKLTSQEIQRRIDQLVFNLFLQKQIDAALMQLTEDERIQLEIPAFLEGVALYQDPTKFRHLFNQPIIGAQNAELSFELVGPTKLEERISKFEPFHGIYTFDDLITYFSSLQRVLQESNLSGPISLVLSSPDHTIIVGYDPQIKKWLYGNTELPIQVIALANIKQIAMQVLSAFSDNDYATFITDSYNDSISQDQARHCINSWKSQSEFIDIHKVTADKATATDSYGHSWLRSAVESKDVSTINLLLQNRANINAIAGEGITSLYAAVCNNAIEIVKLLLDHNADANIPHDQDNVTPLYFATERGQIEIIKLLLNNKALPDIADIADKTPLSIAVRKGYFEITELLLAYHANPNLSDAEQMTPLYIAAIKGDVKLIELLIKHGATHASDEHGETPLLAAVINGRTAAVKKLLEYPHVASDWNKADSVGLTPLLQAVHVGHKEIIEMLLQKGKELNQLQIKNIEMVINVAKKNGDKESTNLLVTYKNDLPTVKTKSTALYDSRPILHDFLGGEKRQRPITEDDSSEHKLKKQKT